MANISLKHIRKTYDNGLTVVPDLSLEIKDKEFMVLVGPSGCGKSTTLRMIAGLEDISEGELYIGDTLVNNVAPKDRDIAFVFQNYALYPSMSVYENMAFSLKLKKRPADEIDKKVKAVAEKLGLSEYLDRKPKALSGGQRQRVALGRALIREPKVFLLDEPLSNLDAKLRADMRANIGKLHHELGTTFVYVTHDQVEAMTMGDRICVMNKGEILQVDSPMELYDHPNCLFVATFIGTPKMNLLDMKISNEGDFTILSNGNFKIKLTKDIKDLSLYPHRTIIMGFRPDDVEVFHEYNDDEFGVLKQNVSLAELTGSDTNIYIDFDDRSYIAKIPSDNKFEIGDVCYFRPKIEKLHFFDHETKKRV